MTFPFRQAAAALATAWLALAPAAHAAGQFADSPKITLRLTSASPEAMEDSRALRDAAQYLKEATEGTVVLQTYLSSSLFDEIAGMGAVKNGLVDMAIACTCNMTKLTQAFLFADLPYLFKGMDNGRQVWNSEFGMKLRQDVGKSLGMVPLAFAPSGGGYRILWNNRRPVKVPADMAGVKLRTTATPIEQDFWKMTGAVPTPVDVSEIYSALQQGVVDGEHFQPAWFTLLKHHEVTKYGTEIQASAVYRVLMISQRSYDRMDDAQKQAFAEAMKVFEDKAYQYNIEERETSLKEIRARGIEVYEPNAQEAQAWRELGDKFLQSDTVKRLVPAEVIEQAQAAQK